jgi:hypothetical protein
MDEIIEYKVITHSSADALNAGADGLVSDGYDPLGGASVTSHEQKLLFAQAFVRYGTPS